MNKVYLLRDAHEIYGIFTELNYAYNHLLQFFHNFYKYYKFLSASTCNIENMLTTFQIIEYDNNMINNVYCLGSDFYLYDTNKKIYTCDKISICDYIAKLNKFVSEEDLYDNNLDIFLPVNEETEFNTEGNIISQTNIQEEKELEAKMKLLSEIKEKEEKKLEDMKRSVIISKDLEIISKNNFRNNQNIRDINLLENKRKKFRVDLGVFLTLENEIQDGKRKKDDIPVLFIKEFATFNIMRKNNKFTGNEDEMFQYFLKNIETTHNTGSYNTIFDAPNLNEIKNYEYSDTDSNDDEYDEDSSLSSYSDSETESVTQRISLLMTKWSNNSDPTEKNNDFISWLKKNGIDKETGLKINDNQDIQNVINNNVGVNVNGISNIVS